MRKKRSRRMKKNDKLGNIVIPIILLLLLITLIIGSIFNLNKSKENTKVDVGNTNVETDITSENNITENNIDIQNETSQNEDEKSETKEDITFSMAITGDIMCHNTVYTDAYNSSKKTYDFSYLFEDIKYHLQTADITVGNLETTFAGSKIGYSSYPTFNTPEALAKNLKQAGFNVLSTANNHCLDKGYTGITNTIDYLDKADLAHTGTFKSEEDRDNILVQNVKGVDIAFLSFTYGTNGIAIPKGKEYCVNIINKKEILRQINLAKEKSPDMICVCMHWGTEYQTSPNSTQKDLADYLFKNGVDVIIGNHPHVPQSMEKKTVKLEDGTEKECFVIYSLGNFMSGQVYTYTKDSAILKLQITKNGETNKISIDSATYTPIYMYKNASKSTHKLKILDIEKNIKNYKNGDTSIGKTTYNTLQAELKNIKRLIGKEIK